MKNLTLSLLFSLCLSQLGLAGTCETYPELNKTEELSAKDIKQVGRAVKNRKNADQAYLACTDSKNGECVRIAMVLEAISCAQNSEPRFFDINKNLNFINSDNGKIPNEITDTLRTSLNWNLSLPKSALDYIIFSTIAYYGMATGSPALATVFFVLLPVAGAADIIAAPIRGSTHIANVITRSIVENKSKMALEKNKNAVDLKPKKLKNRYFIEFLKAVSKD